MKLKHIALLLAAILALILSVWWLDARDTSNSVYPTAATLPSGQSATREPVSAPSAASSRGSSEQLALQIERAHVRRACGAAPAGQP